MDDDGMEKLSLHFRALMDCVRNRDGVARPKEQQRLLIDQLRNALDRAVNSMDDALDANALTFIAGSFIVDSCLYRGPTTEVLKLRHRDLANLYVLKTLRLEFAAHTSYAMLLRREAEIGLSLRDPYIVETSALLRLADGRPALLQPWSGEPLSQAVANANFGSHDIRTLMASLLRALAHLHEHNYVHCDITPSNIMITKGKGNNLKLGDFGLTLQVGETHTDLGLTSAFSVDYAAPEQTPLQLAHPTMDIYSAGRVLQRLLAASPDQDNSALESFARHLCSERPENRPQTAQLALTLLDQI